MTTAFETRGFYVPYAVGEGASIGCMDDRPGEPGLQTGGSVYGIAQDRAAAQEMMQEGSFVDQGKEVHIFAGEINGAYAKEGVKSPIHYHCAAFELADTAVAGVITDSKNEGMLYALTREVSIQLTLMDEERAYGRFMLALTAQRKVINERLADRATAETDLFDGRGYEKSKSGLYLSPERVALTEPEHIAGDVVINNVPDVAFDSRKAWDAGAPAYNVSAGSFGEMNRPLDEHFGYMPVGAFALASAVRHAAIISVLPRPAGQEESGLNVHSVTRLQR